MELPEPLRAFVEEALEGARPADLERAAEALSRRYRAEVRDGRLHLGDDLAARAYLATRLPATYAATRASLSAVAAVRPDLAPRTLLDVGAGPGTATWAALDLWPGLEDALLVERSPAIRVWGERIAASAPLARVAWRAEGVEGGLPDVEPRDLVTVAYVLNELDGAARDALVDRLWALCADTLLVVEPGTPAGWARIVRARERLLAAGAHPLAPCPHARACPLAPPDWCHFAQRVARSRRHRLAKGGDLGWEDEKYGYVAVSRRPGRPPEARVLATPRARSGLVTLELCTARGEAETRTVTRRDGEPFRRARRLAWGDALPAHDGGDEG